MNDIPVTNNGTLNPFGGPTAPLALEISAEKEEGESPFILVVLEDWETEQTLADVIIDDESVADKFLATVQQAVADFKNATQEASA